MLLFKNIYTSVMFSDTQKQKVTQHLIFLLIAILQLEIWKFWQNVRSRCWVRLI